MKATKKKEDEKFNETKTVFLFCDKVWKCMFSAL